MNSNEKRDQLRVGYEEWLSEYTWNWFITLKLTTGRPSKRRPVKLFHKWIERLKKEEGSKNFRWVCVREHGSQDDNPHLHILVGGLRSRRQRWERRWKQLGGDADIQWFDPQKNAINYMLKSMDSEGDLDIDYELQP
jgi:hypothetical protein